MYDFFLFQYRKSRCHGKSHIQKIPFRKKTIPGCFQETFSIQELHGDKKITGFLIAAHIKHGNDIGVFDPVCDLCFTNKPLDETGIAVIQRRTHKFQSTKLLQKEMLCKIDFRHPAFTEDLYDLVFIEKRPVFKNPFFLPGPGFFFIENPGRIFSHKGFCFGKKRGFTPGTTYITPIKHFQRNRQFTAAGGTEHHGCKIITDSLFHTFWTPDPLGNTPCILKMKAVLTVRTIQYHAAHIQRFLQVCSCLILAISARSS